jgi:spore germination protein GerM
MAFSRNKTDNSVTPKRGSAKAAPKQAAPAKNAGGKPAPKQTGGNQPGPKQPGKFPVALLLWAAFFIGIFAAFFFNADRIRETLKNTNFLERVLTRQVTGVEGEPLPAPPPVVEAPPAEPRQAPPVKAPVAAEPQEKPQEKQPEKPAPEEAPAAKAAPPPAEKSEPVRQRERTLYFSRIEPDGAITLVKSARRLAVSDTPLLDAMKALLSGPAPAESGKGLQSFIPKNTRILSAMVRGTTAYLSLSEDFQFNVFGVEGYAASLREIIWTATEFPTVADVQILIEGRRLDYLGEGIWLGSPLSRTVNF